MKRILLDLQYLPPIQYFSKLYSYDEVHIEQHENYIKGSYRNRAYIASANGKLRLSIPLEKGKNQQQDIRSVRLAYHQNWQAQHWTAICSAYGNSPFFEFYVDELAPFYKEKRYEFLFDFNKDLLSTLMELMGIDTPIHFTESYQKELPTDMLDFRGGIHPKPQKQQADPNYEAIYYPQVFEDKYGFTPNLSVLDLLFCSGMEAGSVLTQ